MARLYSFYTKWRFFNHPGPKYWTCLMALLWLLISTSPSQAQYAISTNGICSPVFKNPNDNKLPNELNAPLNTGFDFSFFGTTYSQFHESSNGFIVFDPGAGPGSIPQILPHIDHPNTLIAIAWGMFDPDDISIS